MNERLRSLLAGLERLERGEPEPRAIAQAIAAFQERGELPPAGPLREEVVRLCQAVRDIRACDSLEPGEFDHLLP